MKYAFIAMAILLALPACTSQVPVGHVGRTLEPSGYTSDLLDPGRHGCWGRCQMILMETTDKNFELPLDVLCTDELNFGFTLELLTAVNMSDPEAVKSGFETQKPGADNNFTVQQFFDMYVRPDATEAAKNVVGQYATSEIAAARAEVVEKVKAAVIAATETGIVTVKKVTVTNLDFPEVITQAQEARAQRKIEIDTARADAAVQKAQLEGELAVGRIKAQKAILQAQAQADANKILAASVNGNLIAWRQLDVIEEAAGGANNMFFVPYSDFVNNNQGSLNPVDTVQDLELMKRLEEARRAAAAGEAASPRKIKEATLP